MPTNDPTDQGAAAAADVALLRRALALQAVPAETMRLRLELLSGAEAWERLLAAAASRRLTSLLVERLRQRGLVPPKPAVPAPGLLAPAEVLDRIWQDHINTRMRQSTCLLTIVDLLNRAGIEPMLLKGARSLWLDIEPSRSMRDLDLLVPGRDAVRANDLLKSEGFAPLPDAAERPNRHHLDLLFRSDMSGWVEVHRRAGNPYAEAMFPTATILRRSLPHRRDGLTAHVMPDADHLWHGLVHYHFGHSAFARGTLDLKGLAEFATGFVALADTARAELIALARRDGAALAAFDLWLAAAHSALGMPLDASIRPPDDAFRVWSEVAARIGGAAGGWKYPGYWEALRLGCDRRRLARLSPRPRLGGLAARAVVISRLLPKLIREG